MARAKGEDSLGSSERTRRHGSHDLLRGGDTGKRESLSIRERYVEMDIQREIELESERQDVSTHPLASPFAKTRTSGLTSGVFSMLKNFPVRPKPD